MTFILTVGIVYFLLECIFSTSNITNIVAYIGAALGIILWIASMFLSDIIIKLAFAIFALPLLIINIIVIVKNIWNNNPDR